jgi:hypothetical protein
MKSFLGPPPPPSWLFEIVAHLKLPIFFHITRIPILFLTRAALVLCSNSSPEDIIIREKLINQLLQEHSKIIFRPLLACHLPFAECGMWWCVVYSSSQVVVVYCIS